MYDLDKEFDKLLEVLEANYNRDQKDLLQISIHWWQVYSRVNRNIRDSKTLGEKVAIVDKFANFSKELNRASDTIYSDYDVKKEDVKEFDCDNPLLPKPLKDIMKMLQYEKKLFSKNVRRLKKAKSRKTEPKKKAVRRKKWLRS